MSDAAALSAAEASVAAMIGGSFSGTGAPSAPATVPVVPLTAEEAQIERESFAESFEGDFQTKIAAFVVRDEEFLRRCAHLIKPEFFENAGEASLVNITLRHFQKYRQAPDSTTLKMRIRDDFKAGIIRKDVGPLVVEALKNLSGHELRNREFVEESVVEFARHQAVSQAILRSVDLIGKKKFAQIEADIKAAIEIGLNEEGDAYDYFERIEERSEIRAERAAGKRPPQGITTGNPKLDDLLYHRGWGRKELTSLMGGAKAGKTTALINFAKNASLAGHNVLYVTLEVGANIISDRMDASLSETVMKELDAKIKTIKDKVEAAKARAGKLIMHEYPSGTLTPNMLRKLIDRYKSPRMTAAGMAPPIKFDLIVVDYADIMAPNFRTTDTIENSKSVYVDLRAIAFEYNAAVLTATQTNREGFKAAVAKAEHVAEDFNKVRTVDLMISINKTEEEARDGIARLYFAASRNQESGFTVVIKQNIQMMIFLESILRIE